MESSAICYVKFDFFISELCANNYKESHRQKPTQYHALVSIDPWYEVPKMCPKDNFYFKMDPRAARLQFKSELKSLNFPFPDGYTVSDVVMYWRDQPVVGVEDAELPQFTIVGHQTNERKIRLATGTKVTSILISFR